MIYRVMTQCHKVAVENDAMDRGIAYILRNFAYSMMTGACFIKLARGTL